MQGIHWSGSKVGWGELVEECANCERGMRRSQQGRYRGGGDCCRTGTRACVCDYVVSNMVRNVGSMRVQVAQTIQNSMPPAESGSWLLQDRTGAGC